MDYSNFDYSLLLRLVFAVLFGSLIGLERGIKSHEAGLRTHIILCLGAASIMVVSECLRKQYENVDVMRLGAQVISGIGFLGAGSIIIDRNRVKGITTAAGLWSTACVGLVVGSGYYIIAATVVGLMLFAMFGLQSFSMKLESRSPKVVVKIKLSGRYLTNEIFKMFMNEGVEINSVKFEGAEDNIVLILEMKLHKNGRFNKLMDDLAALEGIKEITSI